MNYLIKNFLRVLVIIFLGVIYFNYRNNQCILKQNCKPIFLNDLFNNKKDFETAGAVYFKYSFNANKIEFKADKNYNLNNSNYNFLDETSKSNVNYIGQLFQPSGYVDFIAKLDNSVTVAKFTITNNNSKPKKIALTMTDTSKLLYNKSPKSDNSITIFNCFCNQEIILNEFESKDLYIYFRINNYGFYTYDINIREKLLIR